MHPRIKSSIRQSIRADDNNHRVQDIDKTRKLGAMQGKVTRDVKGRLTAANLACLPGGRTDERCKTKH